MFGLVTPADALAAELDAAAGARCGHACEHHPGLSCARAAGHNGAVVLVDVHAARADDGALTVFSASCCEEAP